MRMKLLVATIAVAALLSASFLWRRQQYAIETHKVTEGVYLFVGTGMNATAVVTDDGVILVDTMMNGWWGPALEKAIGAVTDKRVTTIINTNSHPSHSANNFRFAKDGVVVIAHEQTLSRLKHRANFQGANARYLPQTTFRDRLSLTRGKERIELYNFGAANTDGDTWVVFPSRRVLHVGDIVKKDEMPEIVLDSGGSGLAYSQTMARGIATIKDVDLIITGHARAGRTRPTITWSELEAYQRETGMLVGAVRTAMKSATGAEAVASLVCADAQFRDHQPDDVRAAVRVIHAELIAGAGSNAPGGASVAAAPLLGLSAPGAAR